MPAAVPLFLFPLEGGRATLPAQFSLTHTLPFSPMKFPRLFALAVAGALAFTGSAGARLEKNLPRETYGLVQVRDAAGLQARAQEHPLWLDLKAAGFENYFAPFTREFNSGTGRETKQRLAVSDFLRTKLTGEVLFAVINTPKPVKGHDPLDFVLLFETSADQKALEDLAELFDMNKSKAGRFEKSTFQGVTLTEFFPNVAPKAAAGGDAAGDSDAGSAATDVPVSAGGWALVGKTFVAATAPNVLRDLVDAVQNGRRDNFAGTTAWKEDVAGAAGDADFITLVNCQPIEAQLREYVVKWSKGRSESDNAMFNPVLAYRALKLDGIETFWATGKLTATGAVAKTSLTYLERAGLLSLLTSRPFKLTELPAWIPDEASFTLTHAGFDLNAAYKALEALWLAASPGTKALADMQIAKLKTEEGIDLRDGLLNNFGEDVTFVQDLAFDDTAAKTLGDVTRPSDLAAISAQRFLIALGLRDTAKFSSLVETLIGKAAGKDGAKSIFDESDFMGVKVRKFKTGDDDVHIGYALFDGKLFFALGKGLLEKAIAEHKQPRAPFAKSERLKRATAALPSGAKRVTSFYSADLGAVIDGYLTAFEFTVKTAATGNRAAKDIASLIDVSKRPDARKIPWEITSASTEDTPNTFASETILYRKSEK